MRQPAKVAAGLLFGLAAAACTGSHGTSHDAGPRQSVSPTGSAATAAAGYPSAVTAVRATCHTNRIMFNGRVLPPLKGQRGVRVGWQTPDQTTGFGWSARVETRHGRYYVTDCKAQGIVHG